MDLSWAVREYLKSLETIVAFVRTAFFSQWDEAEFSCRIYEEQSETWRGRPGVKKLFCGQNY